jgi:multicomponent Na+:H+ antiporter subunit D
MNLETALPLAFWTPLGGALLIALSGDRGALLAALMASSLLSALYLLMIPLRAFFSPPSAGLAAEGIREAPLSCLLAIGFTALGCVGLFFYADALYAVARLLTAGGYHG